MFFFGAIPEAGYLCPYVTQFKKNEAYEKYIRNTFPVF